jgi:hypothetical protein
MKEERKEGDTVGSFERSTGDLKGGGDTSGSYT